MTTYEIHLIGNLPPSLAARLDSMTVLQAPAQTVLVTTPLDQADLHNLLGRLTDLGIELMELRRAADGRTGAGPGR
ncbi:hypothetical protein [Georgenia sp. SYP-B2076]|uniref:hypothetical protein n=1 Tax=Georgenia sp. SYP-B2076 TaxID=2495881 RepID=UPI000F8C7650|nr:hypothetical protein [Georgenia sp. SYP-B2076]